MPDLGSIVLVLGGADLRWIVLAVALQQLSQAAFAGQQRTLLAALGVALSRRRALAVAYARSAISLAVPAGSAVSAAYAVRQYRRHGAGTAAAATAMLLSGAVSVAGLLLTYAAVAGTRLSGTRLAVAVGVLGAAAAIVWGARALIGRSGRVARYLSEVRTVRPRHWVVTAAYAVVNWLLDLACLIAAARACGLPLAAAQLATVYLAVQVVRQIPVTPGGFGLIEASLLAGLVTAGAPHAAAAAVVLIYRLVSCWLILPAGLASHLILRREQECDVSNC